MFEIMIFVLVYALWIGFILYIPVLFVLRYILVSNQQKDIKNRLYILLMPFSFGVYQKIEKQSLWMRTYRIVHLLSIVFIMIGSLLLFYLHLELTFI